MTVTALRSKWFVADCGPTATYCLAFVAGRALECHVCLVEAKPRMSLMIELQFTETVLRVTFSTVDARSWSELTDMRVLMARLTIQPGDTPKRPAVAVRYGRALVTGSALRLGV